MRAWQGTVDATGQEQMKQIASIKMYLQVVRHVEGPGLSRGLGRNSFLVLLSHTHVVRNE